MHKLGLISASYAIHTLLSPTYAFYTIPIFLICKMEEYFIHWDG